LVRNPVKLKKWHKKPAPQKIRVAGWLLYAFGDVCGWSESGIESAAENGHNQTHF